MPSFNAHLLTEVKTRNDQYDISTYDNGTPDGTTDHWRYYNTVGGTETTFGSGTGYSLKRTNFL